MRLSDPLVLGEGVVGSRARILGPYLGLERGRDVSWDFPSPRVRVGRYAPHPVFEGHA